MVGRKVKLKRRELLRRKRDIEYILDALPSERSLKRLGDPKKLPLIGLCAACQRYLSGFDDDCVLHSAFACEMALLLILDEKLSKSEKKEIKKKGGLSFGKTIRLAKELNIINSGNTEKLNILKNLRDMHAHPANWLVLIKSMEYDIFRGEGLIKKGQQTVLSEEEINNLLKRLKLSTNKVRKIHQKLEKYLERKLSKLPELEWAAEPGTLEFQKKRTIQNLSKRIISDMIKKGEIRKILKYKGDIPKYIMKKYSYSKQIALEALELAYDVLKNLHFI